MAIDPQEFNWRLDAIVDTFAAAETTTLAAQLPAPVKSFKGPYRKEPNAGKFAVFISRRGMPEIVYDMGTHTATVKMSLDIAAVSYSLADSDEYEGHIAVFAANVASVLFSLLKRSGTDGWYKGIWRDSDAIRWRDEDQQTLEMELFEFDVTFEVTY